MSITRALPSKSLVIRINLVFLAFFLFIYAFLLLRPSSSLYRDGAPPFVRCSLRECHQKVDKGIQMKAVLEETNQTKNPNPKGKMGKREKPSFLNEMGKWMKIGIVNMEEEDLSEWKMHGETIPIQFEQVSELFEWKDLFPEWIDEEEEIDGPLCPEIPMPKFENHGYMDMVVAKLPCKYPEEGWGRDVFRLQVHLVVANLAVKNGRRGWSGKTTKVVLLSKCRPMVELFRCDDLVRQEGEWWWFEPEMARLEQKVALPVGSCNLALPLWGKGIDEVYDLSKIMTKTSTVKREAYATVLHSSESYVCGAITLAQSLLRTGTKRDLILLLDSSISVPKRNALSRAGWKIRLITRIRNPKAEKNSYNEYNYSKFRLWQLTGYDKIIFIDSDVVVLRNLDLFFHFPQMSATGNDGSIFNSGIMVIEPSNCTFELFMEIRNEVVSYNGGDQGFLNEVFVWWHRFPRRVNFLKNFWSNTSFEASMKNQLFGSDPPKLYAIHYLGLKPWQCYRDYDCNWDLADQKVYASDVAHERWWRVHDAMDKELQELCGLTERRKIELEWDRKKAREAGSSDGHCRINVTDPRRFV
ncbi:UDP-glucuronate:xylan alpha-glucuronosyltransferase [Actinidia chinensis var. chinensis]|uniref:Hexosyltransferase n=1 Tax=Actinidia chinensis var. chinensis TaxID=1590841 RepID=A0A2R6Q053_ACTCC|nr:UDP-glucuronate:xylan alpha-glucuronosyltransferase [Actinidia chinensis var. chinensis]